MAATILLVGSDATERARWRAALTSAYYDVRAAATGAAALAEARETRPDLVLAADRLPDGCARALCRRLKEAAATADIPVILAAAPDGAAIAAAFAAGADDVLIRPAAPEPLLARVRRTLRDRRLLDALLLDRAALVETADPGVAEGPVFIAGDAGLAAHFRDMPLVRGGAEAAGADLVAAVARARPALVVLAHRPERGRDALRDLARLAAAPATRTLPKLAVLPERSAGLGTLALDLGADDLAFPALRPGELAARARALVARRARLDALRERIRASLRLADTDAMTGLHNRRYAGAELSRRLADVARTGRSAALMILDLDHFKRINDRHGHAAGDRALTETAARMREVVGPRDLLARFGGEEFLLFKPDATDESAAAAAEALRGAIEARPIRLPGGASVSLTVSIGVTMARPGGTADAEALLAEADRALYAGKRDGRNCVRLHRSAA